MGWGSVRGVGVAVVVLGAVSAAAQQVPAVVVPDAIAVATFANLTGAVEEAWIGRGISETLTADLAGIGTLRVVGSEAVAAALDRLESEPGSDSEFVVPAAQLLGARWVVSGAYQRVGERLRLTARLIEVGTGAVRHAATVDGLQANLFQNRPRIIHVGKQRGLS